MALKESHFTGPNKETLWHKTIGQRFDEVVAAQPDHLALVVRHQDIRWSYSDYRQQVDRLAMGLLALGIEPGDRVGIWAPNCVQWCLVQFATAKIGAIMVCINPSYRSFELDFALNKVQCKALVTARGFKGSDYLAMLAELAPELAQCRPGELRAHALPHLRHVIALGDEAVAGCWRFDDILSDSDELRQRLTLRGRQLNPDSPINIQFTSGTTGSPKGATLTHNNILNNARLVGDGMHFGPSDRLCIPVPLYHCFGMVLGNLLCVAHGATAVFPAESFDPVSTLEAVQEEGCTALHGVPTMFIAELECPQFERFDLSTLRTGIMAGSPCPVEVMHKVMARMHMQEVLIAYGQTEASPINHMTLADDPLDKRIGTVGKAGEQVEVKIVDPLGQTLPIGEQGEICSRGYNIMHGYWGDEARTREAIDEAGWLHSGDLGIMDEDGYVQVVGRIKDMIIRGGENIYPREVEEFFYSHPKIQDVQVFGVPDEKYGEQVCAWIRLKEGQQASEEELRTFARERITHFKIPRYIRFVEQYPMTVTGKIQKFRMREAMTQELAEPARAGH
ncbi:AMP-binding protein [Gallaecimonas sp. GXIMD4217]|uniref:AMP-binding protein n=1 Tax=Gallaecimonas sp. GXIMD4217 TaxID=3131927 RepID=UPI00311B4150